MERDFMGLSVKQETPDEGPVRNLAMQWSFSNKVSAVPQLLSFQGAQKEKPKTGFNSLASTGLVTITTTEAFDADQKPYSGVVQKNIFPEKQGGLHYTGTYPAQCFESCSHKKIRVSPVTNQANQAVSLTVTTPVLRPFISTAGAGQNLACSASPPPLAIPTTNPVPVFLPSCSVVDTAGLRSSSKTTGAPTQLTIFYAGSVCVYDNVSPEKAQAIMLLAGNGSPMTSRTPAPAAPIQAPATKSPVVDGFAVNQPYGVTLHRPSPISVTSIGVPQSAGGSGPNNDMTVIKAAEVVVSTHRVEPVKVVNLIRSAPATFLSSGTVPQARRKSLARFLEKRKERVIDASPYTSKQYPDCISPGSASISVNSSGSCPAPAPTIK